MKKYLSAYVSPGCVGYVIVAVRATDKKHVTIPGYGSSIRRSASVKLAAFAAKNGLTDRLGDDFHAPLTASYSPRGY